MKPKIALILGMHRSGTSLLSKIVGNLGMAHPGNLMKPNFANPKGYWEPQEMVKINELLLCAAKRHWSDPRPFNANWHLKMNARKIIEEAKQWLKSEITKQNKLVLKDPRLSLTLPAWKMVLDELHCEYFAFICYRSPVEVAHSLLVRDGIVQHFGIELWRSYMLQAYLNTIDVPRATVSYPNILADWKSEMLSAIDKTGSGDILSLCNSSVEIDEFIDSNLRHHHANEYTDMNFSLSSDKLDRLKTLVSASNPRRVSSNFHELLNEWKNDWSDRHKQRALEESFNQSHAWHHSRSTFYMRANEFLEKAITHSERALSIRPDNQSYSLRLANLYLQTEQYQKSLEILLTSISTGTELAATHATIAQVYRHLNDLNSARKHALIAMERSPNNKNFERLVKSLL